MKHLPVKFRPHDASNPPQTFSRKHTTLHTRLSKMTHLVGVRVEDIIECKRLIRAEDDLRFTRSHKCANSTHVDDFTRDLGPYSVDRGEGKKNSVVEII